MGSSVLPLTQSSSTGVAGQLAPGSRLPFDQCKCIFVQNFFVGTLTKMSGAALKASTHLHHGALTKLLLFVTTTTSLVSSTTHVSPPAALPFCDTMI